ncbi:MAG: outer membrane protein assembly factor BamB family protein [Pirellulales bacterium]
MSGSRRYAGVPLPRLAFLVVLIAGCQKAVEQSENAKSLPPLASDPAEAPGASPHWPGWRGVNASGISPSNRLPLEWSDTEGFRWKVEVPGEGYSSPVVWGDRIFLTSAVGDSEPKKLVVLCFDRADGRLVWQAEAGEASGATHKKNGYASASVATDGSRVYAFFGSTGLWAFDFNGRPQWHTPLPPLEHQWGTASSPVLYENLVIQVCDRQQDSFIAAFEKNSGHEVWRTPRPSTGAWSTPVFVEAVAGGKPRTEMIVNGTGTEDSAGGCVIAYRPTDGKELWRVVGTTGIPCPTAIVAGDLVLSTSGRNGPTIAIRPGGSGDVTDSRVQWKLHRGAAYVPTGIAYRNRLYAVSDAGIATCHDAGNGEQLWRTRLGGEFTASLIAAAGRIYATSERGTVHVFAAADTFELLAKNEMQERCLATPAVSENEIFLRTQGHLYAIGAPRRGKAPAQAAAGPAGSNAPRSQKNDAKPEAASNDSAERKDATDSWPLVRGDSLATGVATGSLPEKLELLWTFPTKQGSFESTPVIAGGVVYIGSLDGNFFAVDLASGKEKWKFFSELGFNASAAVRDGVVFIGDSEGKFFALDAATGKQKWKAEAQAEINSSANFYRDCVLFGSQDATLYCLRAANGELVWKYTIGDQIRCSPTVVEGRAFVAGCDGQFHIVDLAKGQELAAVPIESPTGATPAVAGDSVYFGTEGGAFFRVNWKEAKILWTYADQTRGQPIRSSAAVTPEAVIFGAQDKSVHAVDPKTGHAVWTFPTKGRVDSSPVVVGRRVFFGSADGRLYAVDRLNGKELWRYEAGGHFVGSAAVAAGRLVIGNDDGTVYCFGAKGKP